MTFAELNLNASLLNALQDLQITEATTIQAATFAKAMSGADICGIAQTGTGKTFAYLLPLLRLHKFSKDKHPQILVMVPTRELALQVKESALQLSKYMTIRVLAVFGGVNISSQLNEVKDGVDLIVATPGRLLDLIYSGSLRMNSIKRVVIDEMDEMLNLGFRPQLERVLDSLPSKRQNLLFSATITEEVELIMHDFFNTPILVEAAPSGTPLENITQQKYAVPNFNTKLNLVKHLLQESSMQKVLLFADSKRMADEIFLALSKGDSYNIGVIHSNKDQRNRIQTLQDFKDGKYKLLIATDLIARGIDVAEVSHVISFDMPEKVENYIHRIGRTGRADASGNAIAFYTRLEEENLIAIENFMNYEIPKSEIPQDVEISSILTSDEQPKVFMKEISSQLPKLESKGAAFHEKALKNVVHTKPLSFKDKMKQKYKKPKKRKPKI
jgi:ATP-dependent RNA helicase RhlE